MSANIVNWPQHTVTAKPRPKLQLTRWQQEGFHIIETVAFRWSECVPSQTRAAMLKAGWIVMVDGMPVITPAGRAIYAAYQLDRHLAIQQAGRKVSRLVPRNRHPTAADAA